MLFDSLNSRCGLAGLAAVLLFPVAAAAGDAVELKPKFPAGRRQYVEVSMDALQVVDGPMAPGGHVEVKVKQVSGVMEKVAASSKDGAKLVLSYVRRGLSFDVPMMGKLHYDSDMPGEDDSPYVKQMFAPVIGMATTMELDASPKVKSFSGMDAILKKVQASAAGNPLFPQFKSGFTNDAEKQVWGDKRWAFLPEHPVKTGETWTRRRENDLPQIGKLVSNFNCKLDRVSESNGHKLAMISFTGTVARPEGADKSKQTGVSGMKVSDGTIKGSAAFDLNAGQIVDQTRDTTMTFTAPSPGGPKGKPTKITVTTKETIIVRTPAEREKLKQENLAKAEAEAKAKKAEADKAKSKKAETDSK